jgi:preprotein translocase subunit SecY
MNKEQNIDLKRKVVFTILILLIYRFGSFVPIPGIDTKMIQKMFSGDSMNIFGMINLFSGGALERMSIFALNIMPYITSSIIMQLLSSMHPALESMKKEGEYGRAKINQYTRYLTIFLAIIQSFGVYFALSNPENNAFVSDSSIFMITTIVSLVGGTIMLMWFGEKITTNGIGNGISLIIFVGIVSSLPGTVMEMFSLLKSGASSLGGLIFFMIFFISSLLLVCFVEKTQRKIKIQYPNATTMKSAGLSDSSYLPLKINLSGVIPPIFASSVLMFPIAIFQIFDIEGSALLSMIQRGGAIYMLSFAMLILFFSFFYSSIMFNTDEVSNNLKKSNCFILGVRPGSTTAEYLDNIALRITLIGATYLIIVCLVPEIIISKTSLPLHIGGTGILIMVNVVIDLVNQIQSHLLANKYGSNFNKKRRIRVR